MESSIALGRRCASRPVVDACHGCAVIKSPSWGWSHSSMVRIILKNRYSSFCLIMLAAIASLAVSGLAAEEHATAPYYRVIGGKVDSATFRGWQIFHTTCFGCHGVGAVGTDVAPDLTARVKRLSATEFAMTVLSRYRVLVSYREGLPVDAAALARELEQHQRGPRGQVLMPAWNVDSRVKPHILDLYGYLRARADGKLGAGRPMSFE